MISFINEARKKILREKIKSEIKKINPEKILDNGCGINGSFDYGEFKDRISACDIIADEVNKRGGPFNSGVRVRKISSEKLPYKNEEFDCVIFAGVIQYLDNPDKALSECLRVLKKSGYLIITTINKNSIIKKLRGFKDEKRAYTFNEFQSILERKGLRVVNKSRLDFPLIPSGWKMILYYCGKR